MEVWTNLPFFECHGATAPGCLHFSAVRWDETQTEVIDTQTQIEPLGRPLCGVSLKVELDRFVNGGEVVCDSVLAGSGGKDDLIIDIASSSKILKVLRRYGLFVALPVHSV